MNKIFLPDDDTLALHVNQHIPVHGIREGINMGRVLIGGLSKEKHNNIS